MSAMRKTNQSFLKILAASLYLIVTILQFYTLPSEAMSSYSENEFEEEDCEFKEISLEEKQKILEYAYRIICIDKYKFSIYKLESEFELELETVGIFKKINKKNLYLTIDIITKSKLLNNINKVSSEDEEVSSGKQKIDFFEKIEQLLFSNIKPPMYYESCFVEDYFVIKNPNYSQSELKIQKLPFYIFFSELEKFNSSNLFIFMHFLYRVLSKK
ncbi:MAG: hypothetical protein LBJ32_04385 [Oscillospiraceae bacterium]|jgi:hypothetical protein|nr:hypothetical protein [Oscillospiraceae bacterium]